jgi:hypothetical protein
MAGNTLISPTLIRKVKLITNYTLIIAISYIALTFTIDTRIIHFELRDIETARAIYNWHFYENHIGKYLYKAYDYLLTDFLINKILFNEKIIKNQEIELFSRLFFKVKKDSFKIIDEPLFFYRRHVDTKSNLDKSYRRNIKRDVAYIHLKNLKRAQEIKDQELVKYLYKKNIKMIFSALKNNHKENAVYVYNDLFQSLNKKNKYVFFKLWVLVIFLSLKQKKIENHFKYAKVKI